MHGIRWIGLLLVFAVAGAVSAPAKDKWVKLGARTVNHAVDRDEIQVGAKKGPFKAVKLKVKRRAVTFRDVDIHFSNGGVQDVDLRREIPPGDETRNIDLTGGPRNLEKAVFWYNTRRIRGRRAVVELWGLK